MGSELDGVLLLDKPEGPTSHDVVALARRVLGVRRIGHAGTLDPMATGLLVLMIGRATRLATFLSGMDKTYRGALRLGIATDTYDRDGVPTGPERRGGGRGGRGGGFRAVPRNHHAGAARVLGEEGARHADVQ